MRILLADPDQELTAAFGHWRAVSRQVRVVRKGIDALEHWAAWRPDVAVVGTDLPDLDVFEVLNRIRSSSDTVLVLLATRKAEDELVQGLEAGADAFVIKPVSARLLLASVDAVVRRLSTYRAADGSQPIEVGNLSLDPNWHSASWEGQPVRLTRQQLAILYLLARSAGSVVTYKQLLEYTWDDEPKSDVVPFSVRVARLVNHVTRIRARLSSAGASSERIVAVRGRGYKLIA